MKKKEDEEEQTKGGITWIELFAFYMIKGAGAEGKRKEKETRLEKKRKLRAAVKTFKKQCR